ncbi:IS3 family transposase, partial [Streptomyces sp. NPDC005336]|uniref:IS3 family transposase n=1 Tax=Streptomyces sp. NPDC005336 TaxID=3157035 RepID=UPI00339FAC0A
PDAPSTSSSTPQADPCSTSTIKVLRRSIESAVDWYNQRRLHGEIGHVPPAEYKANHYMKSTKPQVTTTI